MGCDFCATTRTGFERNLTAGEIAEQFIALRREAAAAGRRLRTLVFMGMGEPMLNLDAVLAAVERIADNRIGGLGWRQVTISTVGIVPGIDALTATGLNVHLAVSLHAPDDATRAALIPAGRRFPIAEVLAAADRFQAARGRTVWLQVGWLYLDTIAILQRFTGGPENYVHLRDPLDLRAVERRVAVRVEQALLGDEQRALAVGVDRSALEHERRAVPSDALDLAHGRVRRVGHDRPRGCDPIGVLVHGESIVGRHRPAPAGHERARIVSDVEQDVTHAETRQRCGVEGWSDR